MNWINQISRTKIGLILLAIAISSVFLISSQTLVRDLSEQEKTNMSIWAEAMRSLNHADEDTDLSLVLKVINSNSSIPVIVLDSYGNVQTSRNLSLKSSTRQDSITEIKLRAERMKQQGHLIRMRLRPRRGMSLSKSVMTTPSCSSAWQPIPTYSWLWSACSSLWC